MFSRGSQSRAGGPNGSAGPDAVRGCYSTRSGFTASQLASVAASRPCQARVFGGEALADPGAPGPVAPRSVLKPLLGIGAARGAHTDAGVARLHTPPSRSRSTRAHGAQRIGGASQQPRARLALFPHVSRGTGLRNATRRCGHGPVSVHRHGMKTTECAARESSRMSQTRDCNRARGTRHCCVNARRSSAPRTMARI